MLARIGYALFWMGRYLERSELQTRLFLEHYLDSLDSEDETTFNQEMNGMLDIVGCFEKRSEDFKDENLIYMDVLCNEDAVYSISTMVGLLRENARGARDRVGQSLWEAINKLYLRSKNYSQKKILKDGPREYCELVIENIQTCRGNIYSSIPRNETWALLMLGIHFERLVQMLRLGLHYQKLVEPDGNKTNPEKGNVYALQYLKCIHGVDSFLRQFKVRLTMNQVLQFVLLYESFPYTVLFNLNEMARILEMLENQYNPSVLIHEKKRPSFTIKKLIARCQFTENEELKERSEGFIRDLLEELFEFSSVIEKTYLKA